MSLLATRSGLLWLLLICYLAGCGGGGSGASADFYVSLQGNDTNPGTKELPFATLERARDRIRSLRAKGALSRPVTVWIRGGTYRRNGSFLVSAEDSATAAAPVCYRAFPGEEVRISGGIDLSGFAAVADPAVASRFDPAARGQILQVDLARFGTFDLDRLTDRYPQGTDIEPGGAELFFNGSAMTVAQWPNGDGWTTIAGLPTGNLSGLFTYQGERPGSWSRVQDIVLYGYWRYDWFANYERVVSIDPARHEIQTGYVPPPNPYGFLAGQRYRAINVLEELDQPGEWYLDRVSGILYFWPPAELSGAQVALSVLGEPLVRIENASYHTFRDLVLEDGRGCGVEMVGGDHNLVAGCRIRNMGTVGVAIGGMVADILWQTNYNPTFSGFGGSYNGVTGCDIYNTGYGGVLLGGGNRLTLEAGYNFAVNNDIHDYSRLARTDRPAIYLYGVGNRVANNLLHEGPDLAVAFWGNDHSIEYNEVHRVGLTVDDGGAMKAGRDYSQRGTAIRYNYFHDLLGTVAGSHVGVYLDDFQSGIEVYGNLFNRVTLGVNVGGGRDNNITNNIFVNCTTSVNVDDRGLTWANYYFNGQNSTLFDRLAAVNYQVLPYSTRYPELAALSAGNPALPAGNRLLRNIVALSGAPSLVGEAANVVFAQDNLLDDAPGFVAPELGNYSLKSDSPAWQLGFQRIPLERIGLYPDEFRSATAAKRRR
ncbi:right-handed parallel beta-helix repeat-containing protein [Geomonas paludis]|uniref:Right-handed parallel beta-helix repeat-containing protein n=1 Tax=Geomonas paludis TaxID=2740185 RepID=A0ABY4LIH6_9BACT|nr:right-handed parallel beta-helix repeat-containing protein [Geomonas paludis]UPU37634.1 right-handed parallel beta-helix repeat-containing protein [Geomonas paludis]